MGGKSRADAKRVPYAGESEDAKSRRHCGNDFLRPGNGGLLALANVNSS